MLIALVTAQHLAAVNQRIGQFTALRSELKRMLDDCHGGASPAGVLKA
jgi:hypothetical protein